MSAKLRVFGLDLNGGPEQVPEHRAPGRPQYDRAKILAALRLSAYQWVPALFPAGKADSDGKGRIWRVADITGRAPGKQGSCVIRLDGEHAGSYKDHSGNVRGNDAVGTIADHFKLNGLDALEKAAEIAEQYGGRINGHASLPRRKSTSDHKLDAARELARSVPATGTLAATYFASRGLTLPACHDLRFSADCTHWDENKIATAKPTLLAVIRYPDGRPTGGIHRTYLMDDGSGRLDRKMLGPADGGVVMLDMPSPGGTLGVAEGIETAAAAMQVYGIACWSALSAGGMRKFGIWLGANPNVIAIGRLVVFADRGNDGETAAAELRDAAIAVGTQGEVLLPRGGDDFADDLVKGLAMGEPEIMPAVPVLGFDELAARAKELRLDTPAEEIKAILRAMIQTRLEPIAESQLIEIIRSHTKSTKADIKEQLKTERRTLGVSAKIIGSSWHLKAVTYESGEPKPITGNVVLALREDPKWKDVLALNLFTGWVTLRRAPPWIDDNQDTFQPRPWTDADGRQATVWMHMTAGICASSLVVFEGVAAVAEENQFHPVLDYLRSLSWDGTPRLDDWLIRYLGAVGEEPNDVADQEHWRALYAYTQAVGARFLISAVARIYRPGEKADCAITLLGRQGIKKSTALKSLFDPWYTDEIAEFGSKDAAMQTAGIWLVEVSELAAMRRADVEKVKAFLSRTKDRFRPPYGRHVIDQPRQCVLAGTTNREEFLTDETGARRFWSVVCGQIDIDGLREARDQLWAEAVVRYRAGEKWWLHERNLIVIAETVQAERYAEDIWQEKIAEFVESKLSVNRAEILEHLKIPERDQTQQQANRVAACLTVCGWTRKHRRIGKRLVWRYYPPEKPA